MARFHQPEDHQLASLPFPLSNLPIDQVLDPRDVQGEEKTFGSGSFKAHQTTGSQRLECSFLDLGGLDLLVARATPHHSWEQDQGRSSLTLCYGGRHHYTEGRSVIALEPGDLFLNPRQGGQMSIGYIASINCPVEHDRLTRTLRAMKAGDLGLNLEQPLRIKNRGPGECSGYQSSLFAFFGFVDQLLGECRYLAAGLGLDEQIYRLLGLSLLKEANALELVEQRWAASCNRWSSPLDDLVDFIRSNAHRGLTLTDLEEHSSYSARHLQTLFREKFDCTPMQFVRRQRLTVALERLETAAAGETVSQIARDCGYRSTTNFTADFKKTFGVTPSAVLRSSLVATRIQRD